MSSVTVSTKGQIVLPARVRRALGSVGGSRLEVTVVDNEVVLKSMRGDTVRPQDCVSTVRNTVEPVSAQLMDELLDQAFVRDAKP
ncbi:AbrB/MazE/SpoVT family DNA-binding domain-containing protein [Immundisolibacter sp.]